MKFFFDESGSFTPAPNPGDLSVSVVVGFALSESVEAVFQKDFGSFVHSLSPGELANGEPKGRLLSNPNRVRFCEVLDKHRKAGLLLAPVTIDMSIQPRNKGSLNRNCLSSHFRHLADQANPGKDKAEILAVAQQVINLSEVQLQRIHTWALAIQHTLNEAVYFLSSDGNEHHWGTLRFEVDPVDARNNSLEQMVFRRLVNTWISAYSRQQPFKIDPDVHLPGHPVVKEYVKEDGLDCVRMLDGNIHFCDSASSTGIQVADIAANIIRRAASSPCNQDNALDIYAHLMDSCRYPQEKGPGLAYVSSDLGDVSAIQMKYQHLVTVLRNRK